MATVYTIPTRARTEAHIDKPSLYIWLVCLAIVGGWCWLLGKILILGVMTLWR